MSFFHKHSRGLQYRGEGAPLGRECQNFGASFRGVLVVSSGKFGGLNLGGKGGRMRYAGWLIRVIIKKVTTTPFEVTR